MSENIISLMPPTSLKYVLFKFHNIKNQFYLLNNQIKVS